MPITLHLPLLREREGVELPMPKPQGDEVYKPAHCVPHDDGQLNVTNDGLTG